MLVCGLKKLGKGVCVKPGKMAKYPTFSLNNIPEDFT